MPFWKTTSSHPSKQRLAQQAAPLHVRQRFMGAPLSKDLRKEYGFGTLRVRKGDIVKIVRGDAKGLEGKVAKVDLTKGRIQIEGITQKKVDGSTVFIPIHPSKVEITKLDLTDKLRSAAFERKKPAEKAKKKEAKK